MAPPRTADAAVVEGDDILSLMLAQRSDRTDLNPNADASPGTTQRSAGVRRRVVLSSTSANNRSPATNNTHTRRSSPSHATRRSSNAAESFRDQRLHRRVDALEQENQRLKAQNRALQDRIRALEAYVAEFEQHCGLLV